MLPLHHHGPIDPMLLPSENPFKCHEEDRVKSTRYNIIRCVSKHYQECTRYNIICCVSEHDNYCYTGRPATSWVDCLQKNLEAFGAVPRKGKGRKWVAFGVVVKDGRDWMTAAKNMGKWHRGVERGAEALDRAWRRADLRQSNVQLQREVSEVVQ